MTDHHFQIEIPESFYALYLARSGDRPKAGRAEIALRYELCEDLALRLHDAADAQQLARGLSMAEVALGCSRGLQDPASGLVPEEATWVSRRLAELLGWPEAVFQQ